MQAIVADYNGCCGNFGLEVYVIEDPVLTKFTKDTLEELVEDHTEHKGGGGCSQCFPSISDCTEGYKKEDADYVISLRNDSENPLSALEIKKT